MLESTAISFFKRSVSASLEAATRYSALNTLFLPLTIVDWNNLLNTLVSVADPIFFYEFAYSAYF